MKNKIIMKNKTILSILGALGATTISAVGGGVLLKNLPDGEITNNTKYPLVLIADGKLEIIQSGETKKGDGITVPIIDRNCKISIISPTIKVANLEKIVVNQQSTNGEIKITYEDKTIFPLNYLSRAYMFLRNVFEGKATGGVFNFQDVTKHNKDITKEIGPYLFPIVSVGSYKVDPGISNFIATTIGKTPDSNVLLSQLAGLNPNPNVSLAKLSGLSDKNWEVCQNKARK
jgi:hypothetical protein